MLSEMLVEKARRAEREYYETLNPERYMEKLMYESIDLDEIPDFIEEADLNPKTSRTRFNVAIETSIIGYDYLSLFPYG